MAKVAGVDVLLYVETAPSTFTVVGGQTGATLNRGTKMIEATSKDGNGWEENLAGVKNWSLECEGFIVESNAALTAIENAWIAGDEMKAEIRMPSGKKYTGQVLVADFPAEFPQDDAATFKLSLTGTGALTITPAV